MKKIIVALVAFYVFGFVAVIRAQNVIPASGGNASGSGGTMSYTSGQVVYTTSTGTNGSVAQRVQVTQTPSTVVPLALRPVSPTWGQFTHNLKIS